MTVSMGKGHVIASAGKPVVAWQTNVLSRVLSTSLAGPTSVASDLTGDDITSGTSLESTLSRGVVFVDVLQPQIARRMSGVQEAM